MIDIIKHIPIGDFLLPFGGIIIVTTGLCWLWANAERSLEFTFPAPTRYDPVSVAALRGGWKSAVQLVVYFLWRYNLVSLEQKSNYYMIASTPGNQTKRPIPEENHPSKFGAAGEAVLSFLQKKRPALDLHRDREFRRKIKDLLGPVYSELEQNHLKRTPADRLRVWLAVAFNYLVIFSIGGLKLYFEIKMGHSVVFLAVILLFAVQLPFNLLNPTALPTRLGFRFLRKLEKHYSEKLDVIKKARNPEDDLNPPMAIAVYGIDPFWIPSDYYRAFREDTPGSSGRWREKALTGMQQIPDLKKIPKTKSNLHSKN